MSPSLVGAGRLPRYLHPGAWWLWALGLATAASRTTNPLLLALLVAVAGYVVAARRPDAPWARSYGFFLMLGAATIVIRIALQAFFATDLPGHVLIRLPQVPLPDWAAGVRIGGSITLESLLSAFYAGLQLAALLACVGAANAVASPGRLLRALPGVLYEAAVAVTVAMTFAPQTVIALLRIRGARRLRGRPDRGLRSWRGVAIPVLEGALERSVDLAAAMDSRGFGRRAGVSPASRRITAGLTLTGLLAVTAGTYGLLDVGSPSVIGLPLLGVGCALASGGLFLGGRRSTRTRYRPDPWRGPEWLVTASGVAAAVAMFVGGHLDPASLAPSTVPLVTPSLPLVPLIGALIALAPAWLSPPLPAGVTRTSRAAHRTTGRPPQTVGAGAPAGRTTQGAPR